MEQYQTPSCTDLSEESNQSLINSRKKYSIFESAVRNIGVFLYLVSIMVVAIFLLELTNKNITSKETFIWLSIALVLALLGIGIRKLLPIAKYMMTVLMLVTALVYPFLIILYAYPIYLVYSSNGKYLFTKEYRGIVNGTPDFSPKSSKMFIILMILTFGMVLSIFLMAEFL